MVVLDADRPTATPGYLTDAFWLWFGESKVLDAEGKPLVVYHGTKSFFRIFDATRLGANFDNDTSRHGFFFTSEEWLAQSVADNSDLSGTPQVIAAYLSIQNPAVIDMGRSNASPAEKISFAKAMGHDGAIIVNWDDGLVSLDGLDGESLAIPDQYIAFSPEQIKSATGNRGTFDPRDPDITH